MTTTLTIVSGGQTGVDRGALDAALDAGVPCGGWCPEGRWAEEGPIPERYPLQDWPGGCPERTLQNVIDSDATLIIHRGPLTGGTAYTLACCRDQKRPVALVDAGNGEPGIHLAAVRQFLDRHQVRTLNVAGPRESGWAGAQAFAHSLIGGLLA